MRKFLTPFFALIMLCNYNTNAQTTLWPVTADQIKASTFDSATIFASRAAAPNPPAGFIGWTSKPTKASVSARLDSTQWIWTKNLSSLGGFGGGRPFLSPTNANGIAIFDSDYLDNRGSSLDAASGTGPSPSPHAAELISPVMNIAGKNDVILEFNQLFRNFAAASYVSFSNDGGTTWAPNIRLNSTITANASTPNPFFVANSDSSKLRVPLTGSIGSANFRVKFVFDGPPTAAGASGGDYYFWMIDDVKLIEFKFYDIRVDPFFAIPPSFLTPKVHLEPIRFLADIRNQGTLAMNNVKLNAKVWRMSDTALIFNSTSSQYPTSFKVDTTFENRILPDVLQPASLPVGRYVGSYRVLGDSSKVDINPANDTVRFAFWVTDTTSATNFVSALGKFNYSKEAGSGLVVTRNGDAFWTGTEPRSWRFGNYYRTVNIPATFTSMYAYLNPKAAAGRRIQASLYEYKDAADRDFITPAERTLVAAADTLINPLDAATPYSVTAVKEYAFRLIDLNNGKNFYPKANTDYLAMIEFDGPTLTSYADSNYIRAVFSSGVHDYAAMRYVTDSTGTPRYTTILGKTASSDWTTFGFSNTTLSPLVRLNALPFLLSSTPTILSDNNKLEVSPNPVSQGDYLNVNIGLEKTSDMLLRVMDISGRLVSEQIFERYGSGHIKVDVNAYSAGTYILQIATPDGILSKKFMVIK